MADISVFTCQICGLESVTVETITAHTRLAHDVADTRLEARAARIADVAAIARAYMEEVVGVPVPVTASPVLDAERAAWAEAYVARESEGCTVD